MAVIRMKNNIPSPYVSESRDFQIFMRVLDFVQNSIKFDIDSISNIIDTDIISGDYVENLKSKIGFFTENIYSDEDLRKILAAFPYIIRYKGSEEGIVRCVNTFLNIKGVKDGCKVEIHNSGMNDYTVSIGVSKNNLDLTMLYDMLSYVLPAGYFVEVYFYEGADTPATKGLLEQRVIPITPTSKLNSQVRNDKDISTTNIKDIKDNRGHTIGHDSIEKYRTFNTVQLTTVYDPTEGEENK
jgi:hypothetical protein